MSAILAAWKAVVLNTWRAAVTSAWRVWLLRSARVVRRATVVRTDATSRPRPDAPSRTGLGVQRRQLERTGRGRDDRHVLDAELLGRRHHETAPAGPTGGPAHLPAAGGDRIEGVPQGVAESVEGEDRQGDGETRRIDVVAGAGDEVGRPPQHDPPARRGWLHPQAEERQAGLGQEGQAEQEGRLDHDRLDRVGEYVAFEDAPRRAAEGHGGVDVEALLGGQDLTPHH